MLQNDDLLDFNNKDNYVEDLWHSFIETMGMLLTSQFFTMCIGWSMVKYFGKNPWTQWEIFFIIPINLTFLLCISYILVYIFYRFKQR